MTSWPRYQLKLHTALKESELEEFYNQLHMIDGFAGLEESADLASFILYFENLEGEVSGSLDQLASGESRIRSQLSAYGSFDLINEHLQDQNWGEKWREYFHLQKISETLYVGPPWESRLPDDAPPDAVHIMIEPAQAFGTGTHDTTQLCLRILENQKDSLPVLLDIGTGSGILAIAAVKFGADFSIGVEKDPVCEENFWLNAEINSVKEKVTYISRQYLEDLESELKSKGFPTPGLLVCNMLSERFRPLLPEMAKLKIPVIISGFLIDEKEEIEEALTPFRFQKDDEFFQGEWAAFQGRFI